MKEFMMYGGPEDPDDPRLEPIDITGGTGNVMEAMAMFGMMQMHKDGKKIHHPKDKNKKK